MNKNARWISLTWNKKLFSFGFNLFGLHFNFRLTKEVDYSNKSQRIKNIEKTMETGEVGELYRVRFIVTEKARPIISSKETLSAKEMKKVVKVLKKSATPLGETCEFCEGEYKNLHSLHIHQHYCLTKHFSEQKILVIKPTIYKELMEDAHLISIFHYPRSFLKYIAEGEFGMKHDIRYVLDSKVKKNE